MTDTGVGQEARGGEHEEAATSFCVQIAQVGVDVETGQVFLYEILSAHDVAEVLEPVSHRSQIEGGVVMGIGYALREDLGIEEGRVTAAHLGDYKMSNIADTAGIRVELLHGGKGVGALNVKGIGEIPNVPTAAAIANAVADAVGVRIDSLPITAEKVLRALGTDRTSSQGIGFCGSFCLSKVNAAGSTLQIPAKLLWDVTRWGTMLASAGSRQSGWRCIHGAER